MKKFPDHNFLKDIIKKLTALGEVSNAKKIKES